MGTLYEIRRRNFNLLTMESYLSEVVLMQKDGADDSTARHHPRVHRVGAYFTGKRATFSSTSLVTGGFARLTGTSIAASVAALALIFCPMSFSCFFVLLFKASLGLGWSEWPSFYIKKLLSFQGTIDFSFCVTLLERFTFIGFLFATANGNCKL